MSTRWAGESNECVLFKWIIRWRWSFLPFCYKAWYNEGIDYHSSPTINIKTFFGRVTMEKVGRASRYRVHPRQAWNDSRAMSTKLLLKQPLKIKLNMAWSHMPQRRWKHPVSKKANHFPYHLWMAIHLPTWKVHVCHTWIHGIHIMYMCIRICVCFFNMM